MFMYYRCYALFLPPSLGKTYEPFPLLVFRIPEVSLRRVSQLLGGSAVRCFRSDRAVNHSSMQSCVLGVNFITVLSGMDNVAASSRFNPQNSYDSLSTPWWPTINTSSR